MRIHRTYPEHQRGMTLIEIMVVIAIIGMIAATVAVAVMHQFVDAQQKTVATDFKTLESQLDLYVLKKGGLPSHNEGLKALVDVRISRDLAKDPWGHPYQYAVNAGEVTLSSLGSDGQAGGSDSAADITKTILMR
jgi:general secretion pathway protein G